MNKFIMCVLLLSAGMTASAEIGRGGPGRGGPGRGPGNPFPGQPGQPFPGQPFPGQPGPGQPFPGRCLQHIQGAAIQLEHSMQRFAQSVSRYEFRGRTEMSALQTANEIRRFRDMVARTCDPRFARENVQRVHWQLNEVERNFRGCHLGNIPELGYAFQQTVYAWQRLQQAVYR